jgi:hypothetical protein
MILRKTARDRGPVILAKTVTALFFFYFILLGFHSASGQPCRPTETLKGAEGSRIDLYGDWVKKNTMFTDDNSTYKLYISQVDGGEGGTFIMVIFNEVVKESTVYEQAVSSYLNQNNLMKSTLNIVAQGISLTFKPIQCFHSPSKMMGSVVGYSVTFMGPIEKDQLNTLQDKDIQQFQFNLGGKPYETRFNKPNKTTRNLKQAFSCVELESVKAIEQKSIDDLDLTEVPPEKYKETIVGRWVTTAEGRQIEVEVGVEEIEYFTMGMSFAKGTYKVVSDRFIWSAAGQNGSSRITMFLQDMIVMDDGEKEETFTRLR